ncbi:unnamed protein product [Bemisia tabaci]|uniref:Uncharacterized protein n=1 Tax=Bemisia tabaci TaxID=7038 RepID=A0A9P0A988_BEMTA|nr:unnamed protein product [Bemisia tabaci]
MQNPKTTTTKTLTSAWEPIMCMCLPRWAKARPQAPHIRLRKTVSVRKAATEVHVETLRLHAFERRIKKEDLDAGDDELKERKKIIKGAIGDRIKYLRAGDS